MYRENDMHGEGLYGILKRLCNASKLIYVSEIILSYGYLLASKNHIGVQ